MQCGELAGKLSGLTLTSAPRTGKVANNKMQRRRRGKHDLPKVEEKLAEAQITPMFTEATPMPQRIDWDSLPAAVNPAAGELPGERIDRKMDQVENLFWGVSSLAKPGDTIVDFCCGGVQFLHLHLHLFFSFIF